LPVEEMVNSLFGSHGGIACHSMANNPSMYGKCDAQSQEQGRSQHYLRGLCSVICN